MGGSREEVSKWLLMLGTSNKNTHPSAMLCNGQALKHMEELHREEAVVWFQQDWQGTQPWAGGRQPGGA